MESRFATSCPAAAVAFLTKRARSLSPRACTVWFHDFEGHYEGIHQKKAIAAVKAGEWAAPPLTVKLPNGSGYAAISEGALINYAGMGLQADGRRGFKAVLATRFRSVIHSICDTARRKRSVPGEARGNRRNHNHAVAGGDDPALTSTRW